MRFLRWLISKVKRHQKHRRILKATDWWHKHYNQPAPRNRVIPHDTDDDYDFEAFEAALDHWNYPEEGD